MDLDGDPYALLEEALSQPREEKGELQQRMSLIEAQVFHQRLKGGSASNIHQKQLVRIEQSETARMEAENR